MHLHVGNAKFVKRLVEIKASATLDAVTNLVVAMGGNIRPVRTGEPNVYAIEGPEELRKMINALIERIVYIEGDGNPKVDN